MQVRADSCRVMYSRRDHLLGSARLETCMVIAERTTAPQAVQFVRAVPMEARNARDPNFNKTRPARSVRTPHTVHSGVEICTLSSVVKLNVARRKSKGMLMSRRRELAEKWQSTPACWPLAPAKAEPFTTRSSSHAQHQAEDSVLILTSAVYAEIGAIFLTYKHCVNRPRELRCGAMRWPRSFRSTSMIAASTHRSQLSWLRAASRAVFEYSFHPLFPHRHQG